MSDLLKKPEHLRPFARLFTRPDSSAYAAIAFQDRESYGDETVPALVSPPDWSVEAVAVMAERAACPAVPTALRAIEENTVPSWLWAQRASGSGMDAENNLRAIFNRAVGSATAKAWKRGFFANEAMARAFDDEARYALMRRHFVIAPDLLALWGLHWAYGFHAGSLRRAPAMRPSEISLRNADMDRAIKSTAEESARDIWAHLSAASTGHRAQIHVRLEDITADWHGDTPCPPAAVIDLMQLRQATGGIDIDALRQACRQLVTLFELQDCPDATIGVAGLAPLLMALGLAYDSEAGRALAASIIAIVTAEGLTASAEMAALTGPGKAFLRHRETVMRALRNHRRAVFGDFNDYEKLSVLPAPLPLKHCPDLALVAQAQHLWDQAVTHAQQYGLRATRITDLTASPLFALLTGSVTQGLEPMPRLTVWQPDDADLYRHALHPSVQDALTRLGYNKNASAAAARHIAGTHTLRSAPVLGHFSLAERGLTSVALEKIEAYLPCVTSVRLAVTPWIIGAAYCRDKLGLSQEQIDAPGFDLLRHLGFSDAEVREADLYCYGNGSARNAKSIDLRHRQAFACGAEISNEARLRMAALAQSFVSGDTGLTIAIPATAGMTSGAQHILQSWRGGLKSLSLIFDPDLKEKVSVPGKMTARRIEAAGEPQAQRAAQPKRRSPTKRHPAEPAKIPNEKTTRRH